MIPKNYDSHKSEEKWYSYWLEKGYFHSTPDEREPYTIVIPPPNVTGVLHMGHMLNNTIQDVLIRRARLLGKNACWVPGTDHASIATEAKVVRKLREEGIKKSDLTREEFLNHAFEWKDKHGGIILEQLKKIGASCDWERTHFTMDKEYSKSVINTFVDLYRKGKIYRDTRMINWDPVATTAISDEEVIYKEVNSKFYYIRYKIEESDDEWLTIATTRPETILGDSAICINPGDIRYKKFHGKRAIVPIANRSIPIITDEYVEMDFGTGCLKVTPAHDINDYELGKKHNLETIDILDEKGSLNKNGLHYEGKDRFEVRKKIAKELEETGYIVKIEDYINKVGFSERTNVPIEPRLSLQWFLNMQELSLPAFENVMNDKIKFHPKKMKNTYKHWMENIKDWCISRQLWWGHQIPAWYFGKETNDFVVATTKEEALELAIKKSTKKLSIHDIKQDEDVLDTWFSSWLWPISVFNGLTNPNNEEINYYYPTNDLVTGSDIMFFWVARMIIAGYEYKNELPFNNVYYTGMVRDKLGRKMSKSLGNSPNPIELINKYSADGVRVGILLSSPAGNDLPFDVSQCEQGRNFTNKIWNAFRLISNWETKEIDQPKYSKIAIHWFKEKLNSELIKINYAFEQYRISEALMISYKLIWNDFCSWYLEIIKPQYQQPIDKITLDETKKIFEQLLKLIHPFTPFISEEIWHLIRERNEKEDLIVQKWPTSQESNDEILKSFESAAEIISNIRNIRKQNNIANKILLELFILSSKNIDQSFDSIISKLGNVSKITYSENKIDNAFSFIVNNVEFFIPFGEEIDIEEERKKLESQLDYETGFLNSVKKKLSNERFVNNAPKQVVDIEKKKEIEAIEKIKIINEKLKSLS